MLAAYRQHVAERAALGIPPLPLSAKQTADADRAAEEPAGGRGSDFLVDLITHRVPAGVDDAAKVKASFLAAVAHGTETCALISRERATELLGTMLGGYNVKPLIDLLDDAEVGAVAAEGLKKTLLMFDYFHDVKEKADKGNANAQGRAAELGRRRVVHQPPRSAAEASPSPCSRCTGETNTDDLSPAPDAWTRARTSRCTRWRCSRTRARGIDAGRRRQARPDQVHRGPEGQGPPGRLRGRRGRHRLLAQVRDQLRALVHRRGHPVRAEQALRRRLPRRQDRPDLLQHAWKTPARCRSSSTCRKMEMGDVIELLPVRRQGAEERRGRSPSSRSSPTCCSTKCAPAAASR